MSVNNELKSLYEKYWEQMQIEANSIIDKTNIEIDHPANPFLLKINEEEYDKADIKVMIFGQETWGWNTTFGKTIENMMNHYENAKENYLSGENKGFRMGFNFFKDEIEKQYNNKNIIFIWNNISKIGRYESKGVTGDIKKLARNFFPVICEEIKILNPDIVIFLTGNRDDDIKFHFQDAVFEKYHNNSTLLSKGGTRNYQPAYKVISKDLPCKTVKVYHPSYFGGFNNIKHDAIEVLI